MVAKYFCLLFLFMVLAKSTTANSSSSSPSSTSSSSSTSSTTFSPLIEANSTLPSSINSTDTSTLNMSTTIMMMNSNNSTQKPPLLNDSAMNVTTNSTIDEMANSTNSSTTSTSSSTSSPTNSTESATLTNSISPITSIPVPATSSSATSSDSVSTNSTSSSNSTISHIIARSPQIHSANSSSNGKNATKLMDSTDESGENVQSHHESLERPISGEDVSGNENGELEEGNGRIGQQNDGQLRNGTSFSHGELPLLPAHLILSVQKHADADIKATNISDVLNNSNHSKVDNTAEGTGIADFPLKNDSNGTKNIQGEANRNKRDYISDAVNKMNEAMGNVQTQQQLLPNMNNGSGMDGAQQPAQIISIPPIDLSNKTQNIVLVSDTGNVTLRRGNGFLSVETMMVQQQPQQSPKN